MEIIAIEVNQEDYFANKLISQFMGLPDKYEEGIINYKDPWDNLMEIVKTIENIKSQRYGGFTVTIARDICLIQSRNTGKESTYSKSYFSNNDKKSAVYQSCLMFIKWYTTQKPK